MEQKTTVLTPKDIAAIMQCSKPTAYKLIARGEEQGLFTVRRISQNMPRVSAASFYEWLNGKAANG